MGHLGSLETLIYLSFFLHRKKFQVFLSFIFTCPNRKTHIIIIIIIMSSLFLSFICFLLSLQSAGSVLQVLVPLKSGFKEFVASAHNSTFDGFSIQVFQSAMAQLNPPPAYKFVGYGDGKLTPVYDHMLKLLQNKEVDAVVGDVTVTKERLDWVDFTQPYTQSALVVVIPARFVSHGSMWDFLHPFSLKLWIAIATAFLGTGFVMLILEQDNTDFNGPWHKRLLDVYWFICLTLFHSQREKIHTQLGRLVIVLWLFIVLIFTSSYTANLSSSLTTQRFSPEIKGFESLKTMDVPVGYQRGSFTREYLINLGIAEKRLVPLDTELDYTNALKKGPNQQRGVAAIVDELPYVTKFLASDCDFTTVGDQIAYFGGLGFAFGKNSPLTENVSEAILSIAQDGRLQAIQNGWLGTDICSLQTTADHLTFRNFGGLFIIMGGVYVLSVFWHSGRTIWIKSFSFLMYIVRTAVTSLWPHRRKEEKQLYQMTDMEIHHQNQQVSPETQIHQQQ